MNLSELAHLSSLDSLVTAIGERNMTPGWIQREKPILWREMHSVFVPAHWRYAEAKSAMVSAGRLIGTDLAERRNFVMRNPIAGNDLATLRTLICAYQSILTGEKARAHRHAPHALRVILDGEGAYSIVDGEKTPMNTGDIVLTPGWSWHGHGHDGAEQAYWFDGLDVPLTQLLEPMFFEEHPEGFERVMRVAEKSPLRFPWADTRAGLKTANADVHFGSTLELPASSMPTITLKVHAWRKGWSNAPYRHTANVIYLVMDGSGSSTIGEHTFDWSQHDVFSIPHWSFASHVAKDGDASLFIVSDKSAFERLDLLREELQ